MDIDTHLTVGYKPEEPDETDLVSAGAGLVANAVLPGAGGAVAGLVDFLVDGLGLGSHDPRISPNIQRLSDGVDEISGLPGRFALSSGREERAEWYTYSIPIESSEQKKHAIRLLRALVLFVYYGTKHLNTGSSFDAGKRKWLRRWWNAKSREYSKVAKMVGMPTLRGSDADKAWTELRKRARQNAG